MASLSHFTFLPSPLNVETAMRTNLVANSINLNYSIVRELKTICVLNTKKNLSRAIMKNFSTSLQDLTLDPSPKWRGIFRNAGGAIRPFFLF